MAVKGNLLTPGPWSSIDSGGIALGLNAVDAPWGVCIGYEAGRGNATNTSGAEVDLIAIGNHSGYLSGGYCLGANSQAWHGNYWGVAIGVRANSFSEATIAIGTMANSSSTNGVAIGMNARTNYTTNSVAIGFNSYSNGGMMLGSTAITNVYMKGSTSNIVDSDINDKKDIVPMQDGALDFIRQIKPITYHYNYRMDYQEEEKWISQNIYKYDNDKQYCDITYEICNISKKEREKRYKYGGLGTYDKEAWIAATKKKQKLSIGFKAQEILQILNNTYEENYQNLLISDICKDFSDEELLQDNAERQYYLAEGDLIPFLVKAIQELNAEIDILEEELKELE